MIVSGFRASKKLKVSTDEKKEGRNQRADQIKRLTESLWKSSQGDFITGQTHPHEEIEKSQGEFGTQFQKREGSGIDTISGNGKRDFQ